MEFVICNLNFNCYLSTHVHCSERKRWLREFHDCFYCKISFNPLYKIKKRNIPVLLIFFIYLDILEPSQRRFIDFGTTRANLGPRQKSPTLRLKSPARSLRFWCRRRVAVRRSRISRSYVMLAVLQMYNKIKF